MVAARVGFNPAKGLAEGRRIQSGVTDSAGEFRARTLPAGRWTLEVTAPDLAREVVAGIEVVAGQETRVPDIVLSPHSVLFGNVKGEGDRPREGLRVRAQGLNGGSAEATTDALGGYRLTGLAAGNYFLEVKGGPADVYPTLVVTLGKGEERRADFGPATGARLVVTVTRDALPVEGAEVRLWSRAGTFGDVGLALSDVRTETRHTDRDGRADFEGLVPGPYDVGVQAWDLGADGKRTGPTRAAWARAVLPPEGGETRLAVAYPGGGLWGRVLEEGTLRPIGGVRVAVEAPAARTTRSLADKLVSGVTVFAGTGGDGRFSVPHLAAGDYTVSLVKPGYEAVLLEGVRVGESGLTPLDAVLRAGGGTVAGTVSVEGARSVGGAFVLLRDPSGADAGFQGIPAEGTFRFEGLRPGLHALFLYVPNRPVIVREGIEVRGGETASVTVEVPASGG
ncbi:MAG: carboxypeptidase regulatory-like domain-containing protein [Planctomycetales bacterium]|nr:carboxypeptidase regulatory-like domain-containing protein [Planctomycetales bacterium]